MAKKTVTQPKFDDRIYRLAYPLQGGKFGSIKHGFMIWDKPIRGFSDRATVHYLYNPSTVEADYSLSDASVGASLLFPNPGDAADLRVPLSQTVSWSILYDRTYELWGSYDDNGTARHAIGSNKNNPQVIGTAADVFQMQQFTGMTVGFDENGISKVGNDSSFAGRQGILQLIPSWVFFGDKQNLSFYGYISEWDFQVTHWTQHMVPMRCVVDIYFTMLPPPANQTTPGSASNTTWGAPQGGGPSAPHPLLPNATTSLAGVSGR
jgi:hypothetical protein